MRQTVLSFLNRYPAVPVSLALAAGIVAAVGQDSGIRLWAVMATCVICLSVTLVARTLKPFLVWVGAASLAFFIGLYIAAGDLSSRKEAHLPDSKIKVRAKVSETLASGPNFRVLILEHGRNETAKVALQGKGRVFLRSNAVPLQAGDTVEFISRLKKPRNRGNPGEYDWEMYCRDRGICWLAYLSGQDSLVILEQGSPWSLSALLFRLRSSMNRFLERFAGRLFDETSRHQVRAVLKGIVLGDRGELGINSAGALDSTLNAKFERAGLSHMLSASGLHVGIVVLITVAGAGVFVRAAPRVLLWIPFRKIAALASFPAIVGYCLIVGFRVPAQRAMIMGLLLGCSILIDRRGSSFNALALAAILILLHSPLSLFTPGFQLSFAAVAGILLTPRQVLDMSRGPWVNSRQDTLSEPTGERGSRMARFGSFLARGGLSILSVTLVATLAVAPFLVSSFHSFPMYGLFANLIAGCILPPALAAGLIAAVSGALFPWLGAILIVPADILIWAIIRVAGFFADLPMAAMTVSHLDPTQFVFFASLCFSFLLLIRLPSRGTALLVIGSLCGLLLVSGIGWWIRAHSPTLRVTFLNVGAGDAAFIQPPHACGILVDGGTRTPYFDAGASIIMPFFRWGGIRALDSVIATHPQSDHVGGLVTVLSQVPARELWYNGGQIDHPLFDSVLVEARNKGAELKVADRRSRSIGIGGSSLTFVNQPCPPSLHNLSSRDVNNTSVVFRLDHGNVSFLFTGDLEKEGEDELLMSGIPLEATVLKAGHHGGKNSTSDRFLDAIRPRIVILSAEYPARHSPHVSVLQRLRARGIMVLWTGRDGAVTIATDGETITDVRAGAAQTSLMTNGHLDLTPVRPASQDYGGAR
ncbi:MAG: DNA internalization-related competence protein ComEC/Rec2 [Thermodesulfobacteriota bacterium]